MLHSEIKSNLLKHKKMKTRSVNHLTITGRLTSNAKSQKKDTYARFSVVHQVGKDPIFLNCVFFSNKGRTNEREIPWEKLNKGNTLLLEGSLKPNTYVNQETGEERVTMDFVVSSISEPEVIEETAADEEAEEAEQE